MHFSGFFNFEALYLEGWLSKSYEILLVCKKVTKRGKVNLRKNCTSEFKNILNLAVLSFCICTFVS